MSRCFPFPPPGYERNHIRIPISDKAPLIDSIKREEERRKEKKREKKERKKREKIEKSSQNEEIEKKERSKKEKKEKSSVNGDAEKKRHSHKEDGVRGDPKFLPYQLPYQRKGENAVEQLERSGLTEEHGQHASLPKLYDSSDSTQNSGKRKKHISSLDESQKQKGSTLLRIRLPPPVKHKDPEEVIRREQPCSARGTELFAVGKMADNGPSPSLVQSCSVSGRSEVPARDSSKAADADADTDAKLKVCKSNSLSDVKLSLREVIENWVPPSIQFHDTETDDLEWLFSTRKPKRFKSSDVALCNEVVSNNWPRARYLPEAEIYALPYTVPF